MSVLYTIGFTKKNASQFFELLRQSGARNLIDTRLNNVSQLAGFTKRDDLQYFARELCGMDYRHELRLAPTTDLLRAYKKSHIAWAQYESQYVGLIRSRQVERTLDRESFTGGAVLLCSEATPDKCHRRLAADYLAAAWGNTQVIHL